MREGSIIDGTGGTTVLDILFGLCCYKVYIFEDGAYILDSFFY